MERLNFLKMLIIKLDMGEIGGKGLKLNTTNFLVQLFSIKFKLNRKHLKSYKIPNNRQ